MLLSAELSCGQELWNRYHKGTLIALRAVGVDVNRHLRSNTFQGVKCSEQHLLISDAFNRLWFEAIAQYGSESVGLAASAQLHPAQLFGLLFYRAQASTTLGEALQKISAYGETASPTETFSVVRGHDCDLLHITIFGNKVFVPQPRLEFGAMNLLNLCRKVANVEIVPMSLSFTFPKPKNLSDYEEAFRCPILFGRQESSIRLRLEDTNRQLPSENPTIAALIDKILKNYQPGTREAITARVKRLLEVQLENGIIKRNWVAQQLAMTERSMQRKLAADGTSYLEIRDSLRKDLAFQWRSNQKLSPSEIAYRLGFADTSSFYRAWRRWYGSLPS